MTGYIDKLKRLHVRKLRLSIDPGNNGTGLAFWTIPDPNSEELSELIDVQTLKPVSSQWLTNAHYMTTEIAKILEKYSIWIVDSEYPQFFTSSGGYSTAARGDLQKLSFLVGSIAGVVWNRGIMYRPFEVNEWKGQLPKDVVTARIKKIIPREVELLKPHSHEWDAVGIGLYAEGRFRKNSNDRKHTH